MLKKRRCLKWQVKYCKLKPDNFFFHVVVVCVLPLGLVEFILLLIHYTLLICFDCCHVSPISKLFFNAFYAGRLANHLILDLFLPDLLVKVLYL